MPLPQPVPALKNSPSQTPQEAVTDSLQAVQLIDVGEEGHSQRVDNFLFSRLKGVPKSRIYRIIRKGEVRVNKKRVKADSRLRSGDQVRVPPLRISEQAPPPRPGASLIQLLENSILYEDDDLLIINKPQGVAVHMGSGLQIGIIEAMRWMLADRGREGEFLELTHRLDRATSGCLVIARNPTMLKHLQREFKERRVSKRYHAIVHGCWPDDVVQVNAPLRKHEVKAGERIVIVDPEGKPSITDFSVLQHLHNSTLIEARPLTGRTHQIRVHCQHAGHPIVGDDKYTTAAANPLPQMRILCLHAASITFQLPSGKDFSVSAALQQPMRDLIAVLAV